MHSSSEVVWKSSSGFPWLSVPQTEPFLGLPQLPLRILLFQLASQRVTIDLPSLASLPSHPPKGRCNCLDLGKGRHPLRCVRAAVATAWRGAPSAWSSAILMLATWRQVTFPRLRALPSVPAPTISSRVPRSSSL